MSVTRQQVDVFGMQDRRKQGRAKPWIVRWRVDGQQRTRAFRTRSEGDRYRADLLRATEAGESFDVHTGEPLGWRRDGLADLNKEMLAAVDARLGLGVDGMPIGPATAARWRKVSKACMRRAVELDVLVAEPWPAAPRGRNTRKSVRLRKSIDVHALPDPQTLECILEAIPSHQPASRAYQLMTACVYYAGLRPSEDGVSVRHVRRLVAERRVPFVKWGARLHFDPVELDLWIDRHRVAAARSRP